MPTSERLQRLKRLIQSTTVEPVLFLYMITSFAYNGASQDFLYTKICALKFGTFIDCANLHGESLDYVQTTASHWSKYCNIGITVPSLITGYYLGAWSDRFGRKTPVLIPIVGAAFCYLSFIVAGALQTDAALLVAVLGNVIQGICGGFATVITSVMCYIADISDIEHRTTRISILESMTFLGGITGYFLGGAILPIIGHSYMFLFMLAIMTIIVVYVVARIRDVTPTGQSNHNVSWKEVFSVRHVWDALYTVFKPRPHRGRCMLAFLLVCAVTVLLASACEMDVTFLFTKDDPLRWNYRTYSYFSGFKMGVGALMLLVVVPLLRHFSTPNDVTLGLCGLVSKTAGLILIGFSSVTWMMFIVPVVGSMASLCMPLIRSMLSKNVATSEQGKLFSVVSSIESACTLLGALIYNNWYPVTRKVNHGIVFWFSAGFLALPISIFAWMRLRKTSGASSSSAEEREEEGKKRERISLCCTSPPSPSSTTSL